jgi:ribosomal protein S18 acetylase RimI-like enzyme
VSEDFRCLGHNRLVDYPTDTKITVVIRPATARELPAVAGVFGQRLYFENRLARQFDKLGVLLLAWHGGQPAGHIYVRFEPPEEPMIRRHHPELPILSHIEVRAALQRRQIGTALVRRAERILTRNGFAWAGLGVLSTNLRAADLYQRLGYQAWEHGEVETYTEEFVAAWDVIRRAERCAVLVKRLKKRGRGGPA